VDCTLLCSTGVKSSGEKPQAIQRCLLSVTLESMTYVNPGEKALWTSTRTLEHIVAP
jgi:hypothetical protein